MQRARTILGGLLLATFVVGGILSPSLHRAQHGVLQLEAAPHTHAADEGPVWCGQQIQVRGPDCALCTSRLVVVRPAHRPVGQSHVWAVGWTPEYAHLTSSLVVEAPLIRGPPVLG